jgi:hypothetical protein
MKSRVYTTHNKFVITKNSSELRNTFDNTGFQRKWNGQWNGKKKKQKIFIIKKNYRIE